MNSCILMVRIVRDPELRYTSDNQTPLAQMLVEIPGLRADDPPATLKVVGWGNLASEIQENYSEGDRVIVEGRLSMNVIERPEGFKEKRAEVVTSRIHKLSSEITAPTPTASAEDSRNVVPLESYEPAASESEEQDLGVTLGSQTTEAPTVPTPTAPPPTDKDLDDIPF